MPEIAAGAVSLAARVHFAYRGLWVFAQGMLAGDVPGLMLGDECYQCGGRIKQRSGYQLGISAAELRIAGKEVLDGIFSPTAVAQRGNAVVVKASCDLWG